MKIRITFELDAPDEETNFVKLLRALDKAIKRNCKIKPVPGSMRWKRMDEK
jgi:hypothetical protein